MQHLSAIYFLFLCLYFGIPNSHHRYNLVNVAVGKLAILACFTWEELRQAHQSRTLCSRFKPVWGGSARVCHFHGPDEENYEYQWGGCCCRSRSPCACKRRRKFFSTVKWKYYVVAMVMALWSAYLPCSLPVRVRIQLLCKMVGKTWRT